MIKSFLKTYSIFTFILALVIFLLGSFVFKPDDAKTIIINTLFFWIVVLISAIIMLRYISKDPAMFQQLILINVFSKLILAIAYFIAVFKNFNDSLIIFVGSFFTAYAIFTIFEVSFLVRKLKEKG